MLQRTSRWLWWCPGLAALAATTLSAACSSKTQTSGETHFLCKSEADCASLGADYSCQAGTCQLRSETDAGTGGTGTGGTGSGGSAGTGGAAGARCDSGCTPAYGYPVVTGGCVDVSQKEVLGCFCPGQQELQVPICRTTPSDHVMWYGAFTSLTDPAGFEACSAPPVEIHACDFSSCAVPPPSLCNRTDTCKVLQCDNLEFDANGCKRTECTSDSDCSNTDRCVFEQCRSTSACAYTGDGTCQCGGPDPCINAHFCNATADYGPRGDWTALEFSQGSGPCPPNADCTSTWRLTPDGHLAISKFGTPSTATVDAGVLQTIVGFIDGPDLRRALRDGFQCDPPPTDVGWSVKLELSTSTLQNDATGCLTTGPSGNVAQQVFDYLKNY